MEATYWNDKWRKGDIGFHQSEVEPLLVEHVSALTPEKIFVPLCGKSLDLIWLKSKRWQIVGVELSEIACRAFFQENGLSFSIRIEGGFTVFESEGINLWCGDFFELPPAAVTGVTAIYDRAALIALPPEMRTRYAKRISELLPPGTQMLLLSIEYPQDKAKGPPFAVGAAEIQAHYENAWSVREVYRVADPWLPSRNPKFERLTVFKTAFRMQKK